MTAKRKRKPKPVGINAPTGISRDQLASHRECVFAVNPSIDKLIDMAVDAGWARPYVIAAIISSAARHLDAPTACQLLDTDARKPSGASDALH